MRLPEGLYARERTPSSSAGYSRAVGNIAHALLEDPEALAANVIRLLEDDELRIRLAKAGYERIQEFTWERSTDLLEQFLMDRIGRPGAQEDV